MQLQQNYHLENLGEGVEQSPDRKKYLAEYYDLLEKFENEALGEINLPAPKAHPPQAENIVKASEISNTEVKTEILCHPRAGMTSVSEEYPTSGIQKEKLEKIQGKKVEKKKRDFWSEENLTKLIYQRAETCGEEFSIGSFFNENKKGEKRSHEEKDACNLYKKSKNAGMQKIQLIFDSKGVDFQVSEKGHGEVVRKLVQTLTPDLYPTMVVNDNIRINQGMVTQYAWECVLQIVPHANLDRLKIEPKIPTKLLVNDNNTNKEKVVVKNLKPDTLINNISNETKNVIEVKLQSHSSGIDESIEKYTELLNQHGGDKEKTKWLIILHLNGKDVHSYKDEENNILISYVNILDYMKILLSDGSFAMTGLYSNISNLEILGIGERIIFDQKMKLLPIFNFLSKLKKLVQKNSELLKNNSLEEIDDVYSKIRGKLCYMARKDNEWLTDKDKNLIRMGEDKEKVSVWNSLDHLLL